jgi:hypothetical protein
MIRVSLFDQNKSHFGTFDMEVLPRKDDTIEIGFPNEQVVKSFTILRVVHKMIQIPRYATEDYDGLPVDPPWRWEIHLYGSLYDPKSEVPKHTNPLA